MAKDKFRPRSTSIFGRIQNGTLPVWVLVSISPMALLALPSLVAIIVWTLLPESIALDAGMLQVSDSGTVWMIFAMCISMFGFGFAFLSLLFPSISTPAWDLNKFRQVSRIMLVLGWLALICMVFLTWLEGGVPLIMAAIRGTENPVYIDGITTNVHLASILFPALVATYLQMRRIGKIRPWIHRHIAATSLLAGARFVLGGERLALYIPLTAAMLVLVSMAGRNAGRRLVQLGSAAVMSVVLLFAASESLRSYAVKSSYGTVETGLMGYSTNRLLMYYVAAINNGARAYALTDEGVSISVPFSNTISPLAPVAHYILPSQIYTPTWVTSNDVNASEGYRPAELTNVWGMAGPFTEGKLWGLIYWLLIGAFTLFLFRGFRATRFNPVAVSVYALWASGLVDVARVNMLASIHILWPVFIGLLWLASMRFTGRRNQPSLSKRA